MRKWKILFQNANFALSLSSFSSVVVSRSRLLFVYCTFGFLSTLQKNELLFITKINRLSSYK